jgi:N-acetylmuramoyl-L-alanine amidase
MRLTDCDSCSTSVLAALDRQLIAEMLAIDPNALVDISSLKGVKFAGIETHPYLVPAAAAALKEAIACRGQTITINSAYRTIAQQMLLYSNQKSCGIVAAPPGKSNHQGGAAIDIEDPDGWKYCLKLSGWRKLGDWDNMHFDYPGSDIRELSVRAFQSLCTKNGIPMAMDGDLGDGTLSQLSKAAIEGFATALTPRTLCLTAPPQVGKDVGKLQLSLGIKADGVFGAGTHAAVKSWQVAQGMGGDGRVGDTTRAKLAAIA